MLAYLGLGANLGDPDRQIVAAVEQLDDAPGVRVLRLSPGYRSAPHGPPQPDYVNAVVELESGLDPEELLALAHVVERRLGRRRTVSRWTARTIDLDLLLVDDGGAVLERPPDAGPLVLPHPRIAERRFVLQPLADLAPELRHPVLGRTVAALLAACTDAPLLDGPFTMPRPVAATRLAHGSDMALRVEGLSFADLFVQALQAVVAVIVPRDRLREEERRDVELELPARAERLTGAQRAELLADTLTEVLVWLDADVWLPARAAVRFEDRRLRLTGFGQTLRGRRLPTEHLPKAITRHGLRVRRRPAGPKTTEVTWTAHVVLDL